MFQRSIRLLAAVWLLLAVSTPAAATWLKAESEHFIVYSEGNEAALRRQVLVLEDYDALLRLLTDVRPDAAAQKLRVYMVRSNGELRQVARVGTDVGGFYASAPRGIAAFVNTNVASEFTGANEILFHEYAHHLMMQFHSAAYPPWYVEGFAEYLGTARFVDQSVEVGRGSDMRTWFLRRRGEWSPTEWVLFQHNRVEGARFYAQAWLLTHYLLSDNARREQLVRYLNALARREEPRAAFRASFGMTANDMHDQLQRYATQPLNIIRLDRSSVARPPQITITRMPASADDLLLFHAGMSLGGKPDAGELARARRAARSGDPFARRVQAEAEVFAGDGAAAEQLLTELLAASPNDAELLYLRGMRHIVAARTLQGDEKLAQLRLARPWFTRAHRADPGHFPSLFRYVQTFSADSNFTSDNNTNAMLLALQLAPQVSEIRLAAGSMLLLRGEYAEAERLLQPLGSTAHGGPLAVKARALIQKAVDRTNEGVTVEFDAPEDDDD